MRKSVKMILFLVLAVFVLAVIALVFAANYMFTYALDSQFGGGVDIKSFEVLPGSVEEWLVQNSSMESMESHDGLNLKAYFIPAATETNKYVLLVHGYKAGPLSMAPYAQHYHQLGWNVLLPHHRAHGASEGRYIGMGWLEHLDMLGWISLLTEKAPNAAIVMHGVSMGSATTMITTGSEQLPSNVKVAIADCGYSTVTKEFSHQLKDLFGLPPFPIIPATSLVTKLRAKYFFSQVDSVAAVTQSKTPTLFVHGDKDDFVPFAMLEEVYQAAACPKEKLVVTGAAHADSREVAPELYWETVDAFVSRFME
ncbi:MAG: alpha/beta hydrolase [Treponema sp.]|nr:alpha/beta hydrolase [Treponema sp.]